jgi:hypothetical protein
MHHWVKNWVNQAGEIQVFSFGRQIHLKILEKSEKMWEIDSNDFNCL